MSMFAIRLILRRVDKAADKLHAHISHAKASIRLDMMMNQEDTLAKFAAMTQAINAVASRASALAAENASLRQQLTDAKSATVVAAGNTTAEEDQAIAGIEQAVAAMDAAIPSPAAE